MEFDLNRIEHILKNENLFSDTLEIKDSNSLKNILEGKVAAQLSALGISKYAKDFSSAASYGSPKPSSSGSSPSLVGPLGNSISVNEQKLNNDPRFSPGFVRKVKEVAASLNVRYEHLLIIMAFESDSTFSPKRKNKASGALGLIGFMEESASQVGSNMAALERMSQVEQMDYVGKWFKHWKADGKDFIYMYSCVLFPYAKDKPNDFVLFGDGAINNLFKTKGYTQNKGLDLDKNRKITKLEACTHAWRIGIENLNGIITTK
jgi:hypothetical protein